LKSSRHGIPAVLHEIVAAGRWRQPSDEALRMLVPCDPLPFDFRLSIAAIMQSGFDHLIRHRGLAAQFHLYRSGWLRRDKPLPWIDVRNAIIIADGRVAGSDSALVLDLRGAPNDPPVLASDWTLVQGQCLWRMISPSLTQFVADIEAWQRRLHPKPAQRD
jgi:hypothetical protein